MSDCSRVLGDILKTARENTGLSQIDVGRATGVDDRTILNIENYRGNPVFSNLYSLVRFYKIDPRVIFYPESRQESPKISQLRSLISDCTEEEAAAVYPVVQSAINMLRNNESRNVE
ncbi:MAG: helix-turn-helix transcriptional regulator [Eubacteriales bacterium]|nr:helix-turn-helix transcriptional regulator [Eubacteriales bacterium]